MLCASALGCAPPTLILDEVERTTGGSITLSAASTGDGSTAAAQSSDAATDPPACGVDVSCPAMIDLLFVIDNSGTMGEEQLNLARNFPMLIAELEALTDITGAPVDADVNIMVTTTDFGNPNCDDKFKPAGYVEAKGSPVATPCTDRIERFTGRGNGALVIEEACHEVCPPDAPAYPREHFIHFAPDGTNVEGGTPADALACVGPQGIDGCGFEAPLETMLQALNPAACWNDPDGTFGECTGDGLDRYEQPFLRDGAILAIAIISDEADCSVRDYGIMSDPAFMQTEPGDGIRMPSSAICWNAGVLCSDLDPDTEEWAACVATNKSANGDIGVPGTDAVLHPLSRYTRLLEEFRGAGREVIMLGVLGVPPVTAHNDKPPHEPTAGGAADLVFRNWRDPAHPDGDILPDEYGDGERAPNKQFEFGIGPGCTEVTPTYVGQAIPPVRIRNVCESLNVPDDPETASDEFRTRCCIESICGEDFSPAMRCLTGLIRNVIVPAG